MILPGIMGQVALPVRLRSSMLVPALLLAGALLLGALIIALVSRWRRAGADGLTPGEQLSRFRSLYEKGAISREEFERLRGLLGGQLYQSVVGPGRPPVGGADGGEESGAPVTPPPGPPDGIRPA